MTDYKIVCTDQVPISEPTTHAHIVAVGVDTDQDGYADEKHSKQKVIDNIDSRQYRYYTYGATSKKLAFVEVVPCPKCRMRIIKSKPDAVRDNNLDYLRRCRWNS